MRILHQRSQVYDPPKGFFSVSYNAVGFQLAKGMECKDNLGDQTKEMKGNLKEVNGDKRDPVIRHSEMELYSLSNTEKLCKDCDGKNEWDSWVFNTWH